MPITLPKVPESLVHRNQFAIEMNGFDVALFQKCKLPEVEFNEVTFSPAGSQFDQKVAGRAKYADITLEKGVLQKSADTSALDWITSILDAITDTRIIPSSYVKDVDIVIYSNDGTETRRWTLHGVWIKKIEYGDADGSSDENIIEIITLCYQFFTVS